MFKYYKNVRARNTKNCKAQKVNNTKTGYKLLIKPSKDFLKDTRKDIRETFLEHIGKPVGLLIKALNSIIRGKANYLTSSRAP